MRNIVASFAAMLCFASMPAKADEGAKIIAEILKGVAAGLEKANEPSASSSVASGVKTASVSVKYSKWLRIQNRFWGKCIGLTETANHNGGTPNMWTCRVNNNKQWRLEILGNGFVRIRNRSWAKCLAITVENNRKRGLPSVWNCDNSAIQQWRLVSVGGGWFQIRNRAWNKCLNLMESQNRVRGVPNVWTCGKHKGKEWKFTQ